MAYMLVRCDAGGLMDLPKAAARLSMACDDPGDEVTVNLPDTEDYRPMAGWHLPLRIAGDLSDRLMYDDNVLLTVIGLDPMGDLVRYLNPGSGIWSTVHCTDIRIEDVLRQLLCRLDACDGNDSGGGNKEKESASVTKEDNPPEIPKYVQMVHHEDPVVHPPLPKRPDLSSLPVEDDGGDGNADNRSDAVVGTDFPDNFSGKLYRAAAMAVARFVKDGTYVDCEGAKFSMTTQEFVRGLMPRAMAACDDYVEMTKNPERYAVALRGYRRILEIDGQPDWLVMLIEPNRVQLMLIPVYEIEELR